jgi:hypothetical protein
MLPYAELRFSEITNEETRQALDQGVQPRETRIGKMAENALNVLGLHGVEYQAKRLGDERWDLVIQTASGPSPQPPAPRPDRSPDARQRAADARPDAPAAPPSTGPRSQAAASNAPSEPVAQAATDAAGGDPDKSAQDGSPDIVDTIAGNFHYDKNSNPATGSLYLGYVPAPGRHFVKAKVEDGVMFDIDIKADPALREKYGSGTQMMDGLLRHLRAAGVEFDRVRSFWPADASVNHDQYQRNREMGLSKLASARQTWGGEFFDSRDYKLVSVKEVDGGLEVTRKKQAVSGDESTAAVEPPASLSDLVALIVGDAPYKHDLVNTLLKTYGADAAEDPRTAMDVLRERLRRQVEAHGSPPEVARAVAAWGRGNSVVRMR